MFWTFFEALEKGSVLIMEAILDSGFDVMCDAWPCSCSPWQR